MTWGSIAALGLALAVALGAFGAHGLKGRLDSYAMGVYEKAVLYQFLHALGLLVVSVLPRTGMLSPGQANGVSALLAAGIVLFCGSLYLIAGTGVRAFGAVAPVGGTAFVAAWCLLAWFLLKKP